MSSFSESTLVRKLADVNATQPSIQTLSMWMLHYKRSAPTIVDVWAREFKKEKRASRLLTLLYLANDVIQTCRKKHPAYQELFRKALLAALPHLAAAADEATLRKVKRIIEVWKERGVYAPAALESLVYAVTAHLPSSKLHVFRDLASTPPPPDAKERSPSSGSGPGRSSTPPPHPTEAGEGSPEIPVEEEEEPTVASILGGSSPQREEDQDPPRTQDLIQALVDLTDPASFDEETRNKIAAYPEAVANPAFLRSVAGRGQAEQLYAAVKEAEGTVSAYCARLAEEMDERKATQASLCAYLRAQKRKAEKTQELLGQFKEKRAALEKEKAEVYKHYESLPDMEAMPENLAQLPSAGELFAKP